MLNTFTFKTFFYFTTEPSLRPDADADDTKEVLIFKVKNGSLGRIIGRKVGRYIDIEHEI